VLGSLETVGIGARVFKGPALAHTAYPDPSWRVFGDVDVLVPAAQLHAAVATLERDLGLVRGLPELRPGFDARFGKEILLRGEGLLEVDLHRVPIGGAFGMRVETDSLHATAREISLGGRRVRILEPAAQLLAACFAATLADWPPRLVALRDVVQILHALDPPVAGVVRLAQSWRAGAVVARALEDAWATLGLTERPPLLAAMARPRPHARERLMMASYRGPARGYTSQLAALLAVRGARAKAAYAAALAWPSREYVRARGIGRLGLAGRFRAKLGRGRR
jgi:hypothetical protein